MDGGGHQIWGNPTGWKPAVQKVKEFIQGRTMETDVYEYIHCKEAAGRIAKQRLSAMRLWWGAIVLGQSEGAWEHM